MADDIITFGDPKRDRERGRGDTFESLFRAHFAGVAAMAHCRVGDWAQAERLAQQAYLRLWRRWSLRRWVTGLGPDALPFLERTVAALAGAAAPGRVPSSDAAAWAAAHRHPGQSPDQDPGPDQHPGLGQDPGPGQDTDPDPAAAAPVIDVGRAWRDFAELQSRAATTARRRLAVGGLVAVVVAAGAGAVLAGTRSAAPGLGRPGPGSTPLPPLLLFPGALVASIPLTGVISVTADASQAWVVRALGPPSFNLTRYQLVGIDLGTDKVTLRVRLGRQSGMVAVGAGALWLTTTDGRVRGQLERVDPATGRVLARLHLPAGGCGSLTYGAGYFVANCQSRRPTASGTGGTGGTSGASEFFGINAATGRVDWQSGPATASIGEVVVGSHVIWYAANFAHVKGFVIAGDHTPAVRAPAPGYQISYAGNQSLAYGDGSVWELTASERVLRIDPGSGRVTRVYRSSGYDPAHSGGLASLTVGGGSLWFLDDSYPFSGVLRVSMATGRPLGGVVIPPGWCGEQACSQIYATPGAIWVPTMQSLLRLDPAQMTLGLHPEPRHG